MYGRSAKMKLEYRFQLRPAARIFRGSSTVVESAGRASLCRLHDIRDLQSARKAMKLAGTCGPWLARSAQRRPSPQKLLVHGESHEDLRSPCKSSWNTRDPAWFVLIRIHSRTLSALRMFVQKEITEMNRTQQLRATQGQRRTTRSPPAQ